MHNFLRHFRYCFELVPEREVRVVEEDLLVVLLQPILYLWHGLSGDEVGLHELELPLDIVVVVLEIVEQHLHGCKNLSGDRHAVLLVRLNAVQVVADERLFSSEEYTRGVDDTLLLEASDDLATAVHEDGVVLLDVLHLTPVVEAVHPRTRIEHHPPHAEEVQEAVAAAEGRGRVGAVVALQWDVPKGEPGRDLRIFDDPKECSGTSLTSSTDSATYR
jgi:hypothetical protein